jgi:hypothetical protein
MESETMLDNSRVSIRRALWPAEEKPIASKRSLRRN